MGLWFVLRGDWRYVRSTVVILVGAVLASAAIDPSAWPRWVEFLATSSGSGTGGGWIFVRFAAAVALTVVAARRGQAWLLAPALMLACPVFSAFSPYTVLGAVPRLLQWQRTHPPDGRLDHDPVDGRTGQRSAAAGFEEDVAGGSRDDFPAGVAL